MAGSISETRSAAAWGLARRQHGVVTRGQLLTLGFTKSAIEHRIRTGRLHLVMRGVYAVGRHHLSREGRWMAAILACGPGAALSHRSAAALWGFGKEHPDYIDISVRRPSEARLPAVRCHRRPSLPTRAITKRLNIPVTQPVQTFLDLATVAGPTTVERAINEADKLDVIDADSLRRDLDSHAGEPGVRRLRQILDKHTFRLSDDELERLFRPLAAAAGLPTPLTKQIVNDFEVDFFWPNLGLVVETDGRSASPTTKSGTNRSTSATSSPGRWRTYAATLHPYPLCEVLLASPTCPRRGRLRRFRAEFPARRAGASS